MKKVTVYRDVNGNPVVLNGEAPSHMFMASDGRLFAEEQEVFKWESELIVKAARDKLKHHLGAHFSKTLTDVVYAGRVGLHAKMEISMGAIDSLEERILEYFLVKRGELK